MLEQAQEWGLFGKIWALEFKGKSTSLPSIKEIIEGSLPTLMNMLSDKSFDVRTTVSWVIKKIFKYHVLDFLEIQFSSNNFLNLEV